LLALGHVESQTYADLVQVAFAGGGKTGSFCAPQRWQQERRKNRNHSDDDQELDQRKADSSTSNYSSCVTLPTPFPGTFQCANGSPEGHRTG
jgi:hypothetical protein